MEQLIDVTASATNTVLLRSPARASVVVSSERTAGNMNGAPRDDESGQDVGDEEAEVQADEVIHGAREAHCPARFTRPGRSAGRGG